jgi:methionine synthase I (cobalamin-dependent)
MAFDSIRHRLRQGRPLVLDSDTGAAFRGRGVDLDSPGTLGQILRERPADVLSHYRAEVASQVDVLCALTADTTPRALAEVGMQHRSAALTSLAVELAFDAVGGSPKPVAVAGVIGSEMVAPMAADRLHEELSEHAQRLAVAGCELLLSRGQGSSLELMAAVVAAAGTDLPTWAVVECLPNGELATGGALGPLLESLEDAGATAVLFEVASVVSGLEVLDRAAAVISSDRIAPGVLLAGSAESLRGFPDEAVHLDRWVDRALELDSHGARIIGGGAGTTEAHTMALAQALGSLHPSMPAARSDTELDHGPPPPDSREY